ncbi:hypothetical protein [Peribacillus frigoritolerans]|uniref:hypothetical protein n=1 Tax=Peribacillus frigoritolerans TaxID=450367 RepID=UPI003D26E4C0
MGLLEFFKQLWLEGTINNTSNDITMIPNILQLAGAILTLLSALKVFNKVLEKPRKPRINKGSTLILEEERFSEKIYKLDNKKRIREKEKYFKEFAYVLFGILLIICGYISASNDLDYTSNLSIYFICLILLLPIIFYYLIRYRKSYLDRINSLLLASLCALITLLFLVLMYFFKRFAITLSFLGSTFLLIFFIIIIIRYVNRMIEKKFKQDSTR